MLSITSIDLFVEPYVPPPRKIVEPFPVGWHLLAMPPHFAGPGGLPLLFIEDGKRKQVHVEERIQNKRAKWHVFYRRRGANFSYNDYRPSYQTYADAAARDVLAYLRLHNPRTVFEIVSAQRTDPQSIV